MQLINLSYIFKLIQMLWISSRGFWFWMISCSPYFWSKSLLLGWAFFHYHLLIPSFFVLFALYFFVFFRSSLYRYICLDLLSFFLHNNSLFTSSDKKNLLSPWFFLLLIDALKSSSNRASHCLIVFSKYLHSLFFLFYHAEFIFFGFWATWSNSYM